MAVSIVNYENFHFIRIYNFYEICGRTPSIELIQYIIIDKLTIMNVRNPFYRT